MNTSLDSAATSYIEALRSQFASGHAKEHAYRPALQHLMETFDDVTAVNDPKRSEHGNPDFVFLKKLNPAIIRGYGEAKDIDKNLDVEEKSEQMGRYAGYANLYLQWLRDRQDIVLNDSDLREYQRIIAILVETTRLQAQLS